MQIFCLRSRLLRLPLLFAVVTVLSAGIRTFCPAGDLSAAYTLSSGRTMRSHTLVVLVLTLLGVPCAAAQTVVGRVLEAGSTTPVPLVSVTAIGADQRTVARGRTAPDGRFTLALPGAGSFRIRAERTGYAPVLTREVQVGVRATLEVDVQISEQPLTVDPLTVTALREPPRRQSLAMSGYYEREAAGHGHFLRREDIEQQSQTNLAQLLDRQPGVQLFLDRRGRAYITFGRAQGAAGTMMRAQRGQQDACLPLLYVDGTRVYTEAPGSTGPTINDLVQAEQIEAIEMYAGPAQTPPEYGGSSAACGVILIWTRKEP
jgi:hypothetical protein